MMQPSLVPFFPFACNITVMELRKPMPCRINKSTLERFWGRSSGVIHDLSKNFYTMGSIVIVRPVGCQIIILSLVHGRLDASKTTAFILSTTSAAHCVKRRNYNLENGIHHLGNWEIRSNTSKEWYLYNWELRRRDRKHKQHMKV